MGKLTKHVFSGGRWYAPGDEVPTSASKAFTMPGLFGSGGTPEGAGDGEEKPAKRRAKRTERPAEGSVQESPESSPAPQGTNDDAGTTGAE